MTIKELREHCEKQIEGCEMWARHNGEEPHGKVYEEHKLILDLINESQDKSYELWKESYEVEHARNIRLEEKIKTLEQPTSDDCVDRNHVIATISQHHFDKDKDNFDLLIHNLCKDINELPPVTPTFPKGATKGEGHCAITHKWNAVGGLNRLDDCPLVEIEERKVGKWIEVWESQRDEFSGEYDEWREHKCSICDFQEIDADRFNFCPNCGARMEGGENG